MKFMFAPSAPLLSWRALHILGCVLPEGTSLYEYVMAVAYKWTFIKSQFSYSPLSSQRDEARAEAAIQQLIMVNQKCVQ